MNTRIFTLLFFLLNAFFLTAQKEDYVWILGDNATDTASIFAGYSIDFNGGDPSVNIDVHDGAFFLTNASISDENGILQCFTNGANIYNKDRILMENGDNIGPNWYHQSWAGGRVPINQGAIILPYPGQTRKYMVIYEEMFQGNPEPEYISSVLFCRYAVVDMTENDGAGTVIDKNEVIIADTLARGKITGTKHANGRDWWILLTDYSNNLYYTLLLTPNGIEEVFLQGNEKFLKSGVGQTVFSPDGKYYVNYDQLLFNDPSYLDIYQFDRCTGMFTDSTLMTFDTSSFDYDRYYGGVAFSPDSRLLYFCNNQEIIQYDMEAENVEESGIVVAVYDGFIDPFVGATTDFNLAQLGPNGKIYVAPTGQTHYYHVIHEPNVRGVDCMVEQRGLEFPRNNDWSIPNLPNYRLKALIGSPCDTLRPVAAFSFDSLSNTIFTDESDREPTDWFWTFGDGNGSSTEQNPNYTYPENGTYEVCLIATNEAGSDTVCQEVTILVTSTEELDAEYFKINPNPATADFTIRYDFTEPAPRDFEIYNALGAKVYSCILIATTGQIAILATDLAPGIFYCTLKEKGQVIQTEKLIVQQ